MMPLRGGPSLVDEHHVVGIKRRLAPDKGAARFGYVGAILLGRLGRRETGTETPAFVGFANSAGRVRPERGGLSNVTVAGTVACSSSDTNRISALYYYRIDCGAS